jgi:hypothetical protein
MPFGDDDALAEDRRRPGAGQGICGSQPSRMLLLNEKEAVAMPPPHPLGAGAQCLRLSALSRSTSFEKFESSS